MSEARGYRQRALRVEAVQWEPQRGVGDGVQARPKKHEANPDEFFVRDRFGKETTVVPGDWVVHYPDGSYAILANGTFQHLYEPEEPEAVGQPSAAGGPVAHVGAGGASGAPGGEGGAGAPSAPPGGSQAANPAIEGAPD